MKGINVKEHMQESELKHYDETAKSQEDQAHTEERKRQAAEAAQV
jgi:hypothetical protein